METVERIAIIGMGCRFPGPEGQPIRTPEAFWELLHSGQDILREIPAERWPIDDYYDPVPNRPGKMYVRKGYFLDGADQFEPTFFNLAPREAASLDPQQRLVLEVSWEMLEHANIAPATLRGSQTGVFISSFWDDYSAQRLHLNGHESIDRYAKMSNLRSMITGRLAHFLDLHGPNIQIDTACSSSLTAIHLACQSLYNHESDLALAGGVFLLLTPEITIGLCQMNALSADGHCKAFDSQADGFGQGEGCGIVLLKRLADAQMDGDRILAVIRGTAVNHDGHSRTVTTPSGPAQRSLMRQALQKADVMSNEIQYVETHGTGTELGDPIEISAIGRVYGQSRTAPLAIGSVKTNIGHLNAAAGIAGLFKVVLAMQQGEIPPTLHVNQLNPRIPWEKLALTVPTDVTPWQTENGAARLAGVSAFGLNGSNAHVIVEEAPKVLSQLPTDRPERPTHLLPLSAKTVEALQAQVQSYHVYLQKHPDQQWEDICHTAATGREHFAHRLALVASSKDDALQALSAIKQDFSQATYHHYASRRSPKVAFLFTGQGAQYVGMGQELYQTEPTFRAIIDRCDVVFQEVLGRSLLELLYSDSNQQPATSNQQSITNNNDLMESHPCGQAANFAIECALAELWRSWGITPDVVLGHSLGDFAAAYTAGIISLEDGVRLVTKRGQLMETAVGSMVSVLASEADILPFIADVADVTIGVINGPASTVLSGGHESIARLTKQLQGAGFKTRKLDIPVAAHSPLLDPVLDDFEQAVRSIPLNSPKLTVISSMTGQPVTDELTDPTYWRQHLRNTVRFGDGVTTLHEQRVELFVEIGPGATLLGLTQANYELRITNYEEGLVDERALVNKKSKIVNPVMLPSLRESQSDWQRMLTTLGELYVRGVEIDWASFDHGYARRKVVLPTYPFQRQRYWIDVPKRRTGVEQLRPLIDKMTPLPLHGEMLFEAEVSVDTFPFLKDHLVYDTVISPGACHLSMVLSAGELAWEKRIQPGQCYELNDVVLPQALALDAHQSRLAQTVLTPLPKLHQETQAKFQLISFELETDVLEADATMTHAMGVIGLKERPSELSFSNSERLRDLQAHCHQSVQTFSMVDESAIFLGDSFRWIDGVWHPATDKGMRPREVLTQLRCPDVISNLKGYMIHPGLLDACFQTTGLARGMGEKQDTSNVVLPFAVNSLQLYAQGSQKSTAESLHERTWWCHAEQIAPLKWNIHLFDALGVLVAKIDGFEMRQASASAIQTGRLRTEWLQHMGWQAAPLTKATDKRPDCWVIVGVLGEISEALTESLHDESLPVYCLAASEQKSKIAHQITEIASQHQAIGVVYLGTHAGSVKTVASDALTRCTGLLYLTQALIEHEIDTQLWIVTQGCQNPVLSPVSSVATMSVPHRQIGVISAAGTLWGFGRTLMLEQPQLHTVCIDLDPSIVGKELMEFLLQELIADPSGTQLDTQIAYRDGVRYVAQLARWQEPPAPDDAQSQRDPIVLQPEATYLITGGLGALGLQVAQQLVADGVKHLVLTGRHGVTTDEQQQVLNQLAEAGAKIQVFSADITDGEAVKALLAACAAIAPLRGIVHAAGVLDDGILVELTPERFTTVMDSKVAGTWHLHIMTQDIELDFFVCFSSVASLMGSPGQSNYAAANAFMDTLMLQRHQMGLPGLSINWGGWGEVGLAAHLADRMQMQGMSMISPQQGRELFSYLVRLSSASTRGLVGVLPITEQKETIKQPAQHFDWQTYQTMSYEARNQIITDMLLRMIALTGGFMETQISLEQSLLNIGLDSLMAIELRNQLMQTFNLTIPLSLLLDNADIGMLISYIVENVTAPSSSLSASNKAQGSTIEMPVLSISNHLSMDLLQQADSYERLEGEL